MFFSRFLSATASSCEWISFLISAFHWSNQSSIFNEKNPPTCCECVNFFRCSRRIWVFQIFRISVYWLGTYLSSSSSAEVILSFYFLCQSEKIQSASTVRLCRIMYVCCKSRQTLSRSAIDQNTFFSTAPPLRIARISWISRAMHCQRFGQF